MYLRKTLLRQAIQGTKTTMPMAICLALGVMASSTYANDNLQPAKAAVRFPP